MRGLKIIAWIGLAIFVYSTWPWQYEHFEFTKQQHEFDDYSVEIYATGVLDYHKNKQGTINIYSRVYSKKVVFDSVILKLRNFHPQIDIETCRRNHPKSLYCDSDIDQPFYNNSMIKGYTSYWSLNHLLGNRSTSMQNVSYQYEIKLCPQSSNCFNQSIVGELKGSINRYTQTSMVRLKNNLWLMPVYYGLTLFLLITAVVFIRKGKEGGKEKQWLLPILIAIIAAPIGGILLGILGSRNVSSFEGVNGFAMFYIIIITTPILFVIILFLAKKLLANLKKSN